MRYDRVLCDYQLIIVDDGSDDDDTRKGLEAIHDDRVHVVGYPSNRGKGAALMYGFNFALADLVIFSDGDLEAFPRDLARYLASMEENDISIASKRVPGASVTCGSWRNFLSLAFNVFVRLLLPMNLKDTQAGFKIFKRSALEKILPRISVKRYAFDVELLMVARVLNFRIAELPAEVTLASNFKVSKVMRMLVDLLGIAYRYRIRRWYQRHAKGAPPSYNPLIRW
jgi:glycosyltransferase involved in cell wall biosynthesis